VATVLVTGAAGFVGSHLVRGAHDAGLRVVALDDLSTTGAWPQLPEIVERVVGDVGDRSLIGRLVASRDIGVIVHLAGRIRIDESVRNPALYFEQNLGRMVTLLDAATLATSRQLSFVLSSSAAVYGQTVRSPIVESGETKPISPYGASKLAAEIVLASYGQVRGVRWAALRYFNASGAHPDGTLRECHNPETHLVPLAIDAALGRRPPLIVHGADYPTRDGTCVRDYVHVMDLAEAHLAAIAALTRGVSLGVLNLGGARGSTVREVLTEVARRTGRQVPHEVGPRRVGDPGELVASVDLAAGKIDWRPQRSLGDVVVDTFRSRRF